MRGIFQGFFILKICQTDFSLAGGWSEPSLPLTEGLVRDRGGALSAALQHCCVRSPLRQLQPGALLVSSGPWCSCAALLVVLIHLLSSLFLQRTHYFVQRLYWAGTRAPDCPQISGFLPFILLTLSDYLEGINNLVILVEAPGLFLLYGSLQMQRAAEGRARNGSALRHVLLTSGRIILWWCLAECLIHAMYMHSIQSNETYLEMLPPWALGESGLLWIFHEHYSNYALFNTPNLNQCGDDGVTLWPFCHFVFITFIFYQWLKNRFLLLPQADSLWPSFSSSTWSIWFCLVFRPCWLP